MRLEETLIHTLKQFSGILVFLSFLSTILFYFIGNDYLIYSGLLAWAALVMLFPSLRNKKLLSLFLLLSVSGFVISTIYGFDIDFKKVFTANQYLLTLLVGVGFLRLITSPKQEHVTQIPKGKNSFFKTYFGVHLFGSVINMSSLILVGDKLHKRKPLSDSQIVLLTRAFASDAYWSPFFVAFAVVSVYTPRLDNKIILLNGLVLALIAFLFTWFEVMRNKEFRIEEFEGYPISYESLILPFSLAILVLVTNHYYPSIKIIILIPAFALTLTLAVLSIKKSVLDFFVTMKHHILEDLPNMSSEISLFLVAGMFGIAMSSIVVGLHVTLPFTTFDWPQASLLLAALVIVSFLGVHPVISIAIISSFLHDVNHTLFAAAFLMAWASTISTSPFSGVNLAIVPRYHLDGKRIFMLNIFYTLKMYVVHVLCLYVLSQYLDI
jgi:hypothetical protein